MSDPNLFSFAGSVAGLPWGDSQHSACGKVIHPLTVPRRLDCVLSPTQAAVRVVSTLP